MCNIWKFFIILSFLFAQLARAADMLEHCDMVSVASENNLKDVAEFIQKKETQWCILSEPEFRQKQFLGLKDNWAQEMIGTDLVKERIQNLKISTVHPVQVGMVDIEFFGAKDPEADCKESRCHGMKSRMLMVEDKKFGIGSFAKTILFNPREEGKEATLRDDSKMIEKFKDVNIVNFSYYHSLFHRYGNSTKELVGDINNTFDIYKLLKSKTFVVSSGNARSENGEAHQETGLIKHENAIVVGAVSARGLPASFTNKSDAVTVMAPGTEMKAASDLEYMGTSAAAPIVSGVLSDIEALLGPLNGQEQKTLIRHTSTPLPINALEPGLHGAGLINHYKMFRVAEKIQKDPAWPNDKNLLNKKEFYNFDQEAEDLEQQAMKEMKTFKCENIQKATRLLRQSFLLKPSALNRYLLSKLYRTASLIDTAEFYEMSTSQDIQNLGRGQIGMGRGPDLNRVLDRHPEILRWEYEMAGRLMNVTFPEGKGGMGVYYPKKVKLLEPVEVEGQVVNGHEAVLQETTDPKASPTRPSDPKPQDR